MNVTIGGIARTVEITSFDKLGDVKVCMLTTTADGSVGFQQLNQEVVDTIYASFPVDTASGDIASFVDGADNVPVRELKLNLEPYQNLNGYDSPWVGGAGKNKFAINESATSSDVFSSANASTGVIGIADTTAIKWVTPYIGYTDIVSGKTYTISGGVLKYGRLGASTTTSQPTSSNAPDTSIGLAIQSAISNATASRTFTANATQRIYWFYCTDAGNVNHQAFTVQPVVVEGSSAGTYAPYENICPIYPANGKNLLDVGSPRTITENGITWTVNEDGTVSATGTATSDTYLAVTAEGTYTAGPYIYTGNPSGSSSSTYRTMYRWDVSGTWSSWVYSEGDSSTATLPDTTKVNMRFQVRSGQTVNVTWHPMLRHAEITDSTYVPYNAIGITRAGKNLCDVSATTHSTYNIGSIPNTLLPNTQYMFSVNGTTTKKYRLYLASTSTPLNAQIAINAGYIGGGESQAFTTPSNMAGYLLCLAGNSNGAGNEDLSLILPQIELGSTATTYEPYTAERYYPISANPVYGGTLEVETGLLTVTHGVKIYDGTENWSTENTYNFYSGTGRGSGSQQTDYQCSHWKYNNILGNSTDTSKMPSAYISMSGNFNVQRADISHTGADMKQWCLNQYQNGTPLTVVFRLTTPQTYQLTPVQVKTLLGYNNIWTDSGTVEVQYRANIGLYIQKVIGTTEDDMVANQNISANKYFFVGEELYYSTSAISAGQTIIVGTNCIKTNLADALNALNS